MSRTTLKGAMETLVEGTLEDGEHPSPGELLAYQADELATADRTRIQEHLAWCSDCARTVLDLAAWPEVELLDPSLERTAAEEAEDWQVIRQRLQERAAREADTESALASPERPGMAVEAPIAPQPGYGPIHLLAAGLLFAVIGLSVQLVKLSQPTAVVAGPQVNVLVVDLEPLGGPAIRNESSPETEVPAGMETVVFLLVQEDFRTFDDHAVELCAEDGGVLWQTAGLVSPPEGGFSVSVPLAVLPSDVVEIRLYGVNQEGRELLATYRARIDRQAD